MTSLSGDLEAEASNFDSENWRSVVPQVKSISSDIDTSQQTLISDLDDLDAAIEE